MAKKPAKAAEKPKTKPKDASKRGGPRPNSGRKPKAVTELKAALISESVVIPGDLGPATPIGADERTTAADYAFRLFVREMQNADRSIELRLDCGREVMNRTWGKPRQAVEISGPEGEPLKAYVGFNPDDV